MGYRETYEMWCTDPYFDDKTKEELRNLAGDEKEIEDRIYEIIDKMDVKKVWINPDCGLKTRGNAETWPSLENLVAAAKAVRAKLDK